MSTPGDDFADRGGNESAADREHVGAPGEPQPQVSAGEDNADTDAGQPAGEANSDAATDEEFLADFMRAFDQTDTAEPDIGFSLFGDSAEAAPAAAPTVDLVDQAAELGRRIAKELAAVGPEGWRRLEAVFTLTTAAELALVVYSDDDQRELRAQPTPEVVALARTHRELSAQLSDGPWWRLLLTLTSAGKIDVDYDYGDEPFPDDQLFPAEVYRADLEVFPRQSLPVWLAAYISHGDRQSRPPREAAIQARADRDAGVRPVESADDFPAFPVLAARWAVIAACFVAAGSQWGPRVLPALYWFEGSRRSGSTLYALPGNRAVLSGGVWNAPELDQTYNGGAPMPGLFDGAPEWIANPVLNPRAANGLLSFCYWWEGDRWYRAESPAADRLSDAVPGVWTTQTVVDVVSGLIAEEPTDEQRAAVHGLVTAAEIGVVSRETLVEIFGDDGTFDVDSAFYQLTLAGVTMTLPDPMPQQDAITRVREHILDRGMDTTGYPLEDLRADRISVGWMVYAPTKPGEISIGRAIFYIADDGVLEQSSSSVAPSVFAAEFEQRFQQRHGTVRA